jgi:hypothetical protein
MSKVTFKDCYEKLRALFVNVGSHIIDQKYSDTIEEMFGNSAEKIHLLDDIFIMLCFMINNSNMKDLSTSFSIRDFDFGGLNRDLLELLYEEYQKSDKAAAVSGVDPAGIFPECVDIFTKCNTSFLIPSTDIISDAPKNAEVVNIAVPNCLNMVFDVRPLLDDEFIKAKFGNIDTRTGVNSTILDRFDFMKIYTNPKPSNEIISEDINSTKVYQQLDDKHVRELRNGLIHEKDYNLINYNQFITNWENRRILALRRNYHGVPKSINTGAIIGKIKGNIYDKRQRVQDAIFNAYKDDNLSNDDILQILISSCAYQDKLPRNVRMVDFDKYFNGRDVSANIL